MHPDKNELEKKRYATLPNDQLLDILYHKEDYTPEAARGSTGRNQHPKD